jgi:hypothetical protein
VVWFYKRHDGALRIETRFDAVTNEYVLDVAWPDRPAETERFSDAEQFRIRTVALERQLDADNWTQIGGPDILPHGWRGDFLH